jgi:Right handed beta helix region
MTTSTYAGVPRGVNLLHFAPLMLLFGATWPVSARADSARCPPASNIVYIDAPSSGGSLQQQQQANDAVAAKIMSAVTIANTEVLLAQDVDIDFSRMSGMSIDGPLLILAPCVTLASYKRWSNPVSGQGSRTVSPSPPVTLRPRVVARVVPPPSVGVPGEGLVLGGGRTPNELGPALRWSNQSNPLRQDGAAFIGAGCTVDPSVPSSNGGMRILGIRIIGPTPDNHFTAEKGVYVTGCHDFEIANSEVYGWGGSGIRVDDCPGKCGIPNSEPPLLYVRIHDNYIHHNQHSNNGGNSEGYGIEVGPGAFAEIYQNVFDYNKHSVMADGHAGGYNALRNLVLKGGGLQESIAETWIHVFDVHGTQNCPNTPLTQEIWNCGDGGYQFLYEQNAFQYLKALDIKIRGTPKREAIITRNIFARSDEDDAIGKGDHVNVTSSNQYNIDTFAQYGVCDIDGDGIDDLVLMTGVTWWYSSAGRYPWSFLRTDDTVLKDVQLGDIDGDGRCDVIKQGLNDSWMISSGAKAEWKLLGNFAAPLAQVHLGRFDPNAPDLNRGIRSLTHAFWRKDSGQWFVTSLNNPTGWTAVGSSSFAFADIRFGDFTGDGVTDVLANEGGHWAISNAARGQWKTLNNTLNDPVKDGNIYIANTDAGDNVDDIYRLDQQLTVSPPSTPPALVGAEEKWVWQRSADGVTPWRSFKTFDFNLFPIGAVGELVIPNHGFFGNFGGGQPGASVMVIDFNRIGHFYSPAQGNGRDEWQSLFAY